jgi:hydroxymethylbilane synthase
MLTIGSRGSQLALAQSRWVKQQIIGRYPQTRVEIRVIRTSADRDQKTSIRSGSATGVFVKEIEDALMAGEIDLAVHSMKDVPTRIPDELHIEAIPPREDPRDALISSVPLADLRDLPQHAVIGTGSVRRQAQLLALRPDLRVRDIRGNVDTRIGKLQSGEYSAIVLACAGLNRLGLQDKISLPLEITSMLPAPGQGALALEIRKDDKATASFISDLNHWETAVAVRAEREFLRAIGGGCNSPIAVHACPVDGMIRIEGLAAAPDGSRTVRAAVSAVREAAESSAGALAEKILQSGGREILDAHRQSQ